MGVPLIIVALSGLSVSFIPGPSNTISSVSTMSSVKCDQRPGNPATVGATVYHVTSTHAVICVNFVFRHAGSVSFQRQLQPWVEVSTWYNTLCGANPNRDLSHLCFDPRIYPSPATASVSIGERVTVAYNIESTGNTTGLYQLFLSPCGPIELAFGEVPSSVYFSAYSCGPVAAGPPPGISVIGVTNIDTVSVPWS